MSSPRWVRSVLQRGLPLARPLARLTRLPVVGRLTELALFEGDDLVVLTADRVIAVDRVIEPAAQQVAPSQVVEHFIDEAAFIFRMDRCICRDGQQCRDYPRDLGCLFLGEAARGINPDFGREVSAAEARDHIARCREAGLIHLVGRNKLDSVWLNVSPGERLLTVCSCCPCCCLWRIVPDLTGRIAEKVSRLPGVELRVDADRCVGCGTCSAEGACFVDAVSLGPDGVAQISDECRGCGRCAARCPQAAIEVSFDGAAQVPALIRRLERLVDVD